LRFSAKVVVGNDSFLRLGTEVHERITGDEKVDARDRRILHQVVVAEDDVAAEDRVEELAELLWMLLQVLAVRKQVGGAHRNEARLEAPHERRAIGKRAAGERRGSVLSDRRCRAFLSGAAGERDRWVCPRPSAAARA
jgi:hypothetical protein